MGALQVLSRNGEWIDADPIPGALVVNIGDMLNILTNDLYHATLHRVVHRKQSYRVSVPFFYEPNFDAKIAPIPKCLDETGGHAKHAPVIYGEHLLSKVSNNFDINKQL
jgi:isopenicillin N synthase-like dioxygenase